MATVKTTVRNSLKNYPTLMDSRTSALHQILCSTGGSYSWKNGQAVYRWRYKPWNGFDPEVEFGKYFEAQYIAENLFWRKEYNELVENYRHAKYVVDNVDTLSTLVKDTVVNNFYTEFFQQTETALLMNIPDDVTPDWAEACEEIKILAIESGWVF